MRLIVFYAGLFILLFGSGPVMADRVENFRLLDQEHASHELYYHKDAKAVVLMVTMNGCPIVRNMLPDLRAIRSKFGDKVEFKLINSSLQDTYSSIREEVADFGIDFPVLVDDTQLIGEVLELNRSGEVKHSRLLLLDKPSMYQSAIHLVVLLIFRNINRKKHMRKLATATPLPLY
jgi:hypothetical protein